MSRQSGDIIGGRYRLDRRLGGGGFGEVFAAFDNELRREVAIKVLDPRRDAKDAREAENLRERFRREAVATASIRHPNVVTVYDIGVSSDDGDIYIVMELLVGRSLKEELDVFPNGLDPVRMIPHFVECLDALGHGHERGIVHKDLKPDNLFVVSPAGRAESMLIIDFGVARVVHEQKLTSTGRIVGTPRYLAPEYIEGHHVSPALDVYQMGLILVEALTGTPCVPKQRDLVACCQMHLDGELRIPKALLETALGPVIARATARDPNARFPSGREFAEALATIDPQAVLMDRRSELRETPRLGLPHQPAKPQREPTQRMHGGVDAAVGDEPDTISEREQSVPAYLTAKTVSVLPSAAGIASALPSEPEYGVRSRPHLRFGLYASGITLLLFAGLALVLFGADDSPPALRAAPEATADSAPPVAVVDPAATNRGSESEAEEPGDEPAKTGEAPVPVASTNGAAEESDATARVEPPPDRAAARPKPKPQSKPEPEPKPPSKPEPKRSMRILP